MAEHLSGKNGTGALDLGEGRPLFTKFDYESEGGLAVAPVGVDQESGEENKRVFETSHPKWKIDQGSRAKELPYSLLENTSEGCSERRIEYTGNVAETDSSRVTLGLEVELGVHHQGKKYYVTEIPGKFVAPNGELIDFGDIEVDPEAYRVMLELKTKMAKGVDDLSQKGLELKAELVEICQEYDIYPDFLSAYPSQLSGDEMLDHPYVRQTAYENMPKLDGLFVCTSEQLNIGWASPEAGRHAMSMYQQYAPLMSLVTGAAPMHNDKIGVTVKDLLGVGADKEMTNNMTGELLVDSDDYLRQFPEQKIFDVREFQRIFGSSGGGTWDRPSPISNERFLMEADGLLRNGEIMSAERTMGAHRDRIRGDRMEICSLSGAGGNMRIVKATHELVVAYLMKQQRNFLEAMDEAGEGADPDEVLKEQREMAVSTSHANNVFAAISGKESGHQINIDGQEKVLSPAEMLKLMIKEAGGIKGVDGNDGSEGISVESACELFARLQEAPRADEYKNPEKTAEENVEAVFDDFFSQYSSMTATEALHLAHKVQPGVPTNELVRLYSKKAQQHILDEARASRSSM